MKNKIRLKLVVFIVVVSLFTILIIVDGTLSTRLYASVYQSNYINRIEDSHGKIFANALKAQSSHNMQPWLIERLDSFSYQLLADKDKELKVVDSDNIQMLISQGTFLESLKQTAPCYGYDTKLKLFTPNFDLKKVIIANIDFFKTGAKKDIDLVAGSSYNQSIEGEYIITTQIQEVRDRFREFNFDVINKSEAKKLEDYLLRATEIESKNEDAMKELINNYRWTERDKNKYRYGLSFDFRVSFLKPVVQPTLKLIFSNWKLMGKQSVSIFKNKLDNNISYILVKAPNQNINYLSYLKLGQLYQSLVYKLTSHSVRPYYQILQPYGSMIELNKEFQLEFANNETILFIIAIQDVKALHKDFPVRHLLSDILK